MVKQTRETMEKRCCWNRLRKEVNGPSLARGCYFSASRYGVTTTRPRIFDEILAPFRLRDFYFSTIGLIPTGTICPEIVIGLLAVVIS